MNRFAAVALMMGLLSGTALAGPEMAGSASQTETEVTERRVVRRSTKTYTEIAPQAAYARPEPAGIAHVYGTRRYAGRTYLIVPGQWYPPVWEDPCAVKRTCAIPGVAPWPGVRVDVNSDEIPLAPMAPPPVPIFCGPPRR